MGSCPQVVPRLCMPAACMRTQTLSDMRSVRTSFNIAIGADGPDTQRTARSALLQMLNTTFKRVTLLPMVGVYPCVVSASCCAGRDGAAPACQMAMSPCTTLQIPTSYIRNPKPELLLCMQECRSS